MKVILEAVQINNYLWRILLKLSAPLRMRNQHNFQGLQIH